MTTPPVPARGAMVVRIVVAVAVHDRRDVTVAWLQSLLAADQTGLDLHVVLVDDGSSDGTAEAVREIWPTAEIIPEDGQQYYARGTNLAIDRALAEPSDYVLVSNDDTIVEHGCLQRLVACAEAHERSVVGPVLVRSDDPGRVFQTYPRWQTRYGGWRHRHHLRLGDLPTEPLEVDVIVGNCILVPTEAVRECGLLDDRGRHNWVGDAEWTPRLARAGWQLLIEPTARVVCRPNDVVPSPWSGGIRGVRRALVDPLSPYSWRATWANRVVSGPDPARGAAAFAIHVGRLAARRVFRGTWPDWPDEPVPGPGARTLPVNRSHPAGEAGSRRPGDIDIDIEIDVVLVWPYLTWGGAQTHLIGMATHLHEGFRYRALVPDGTDAHLVAMMVGHGIAVETYGPPIDLDPATTIGGKAIRRLRDLRAHLALWRAVRPLDPATTVLHVDLAPWSSSLLVRTLSRRFVVFQTLHTAPPVLSPLRRGIWRAKVELVRSAPTYQFVVGNRDAGLGFDRLLGRSLGAALTPTAVDLAVVADATSSVERSTERDRLGVPDGVALLVGVGQLVDRKGIDVAIAALALRNGSPVALRWFGSGPSSDQLIRQARRSGVDDQFELVDPARFATRADLFRAVAAADVFLQPSREEGLPLALVEAMALGVPVVASEVNGIPEVVDHDVTGLLVPANDAVALACAIDTLLDDPGHAERLAKAGRARIAEDHDLARVAATMGVLYRRALQHAGERAAIGEKR